MHRILLRALFRSSSWIAVCMITDFFGTTQRFNVPGAVAESNWSERLPHTIDQWRKKPELREMAAWAGSTLKELGRA